MLPAPDALRFVSVSPAPPPKRVPFGLAVWTADAPAVALLLDLSSGKSLPTACAQVPEGDAYGEGTLMVILGESRAAPSILGRYFTARRAPIPRSVRATALLARGFVRIGAAFDPASGADLVWGYGPTRRA